MVEVRGIEAREKRAERKEKETDGAQASKCGFYKLIECIIKEICHGMKQNAKIYAIGETECNETLSLYQE